MKHSFARPIGVLLIAVIYAVTTVSTGAAQTQPDVPDGRYSGVASMAGGFIVDVTEVAGVPGFIIVRSALSGPAELTVDGTSPAGSWGLAGSGALSGWFGNGITMSASTTYDASGTFGGTVDAARMTGSVTTESSATFAFATAQTSDRQELDELLTGVWVDCGRLYARFDRAIAAEIESFPGFEEQLVGLLYLRDGAINDDLLEEAAALATEAATLAEAADQISRSVSIPIPEGLLTGDAAAGQALSAIADSATDADAGLIRPEQARQMAEEILPNEVAPLIEEAARVSPRWVLERAVELLNRIEQLEAALAGDCPPDAQFSNLLSGAAAAIVETLLDLVDKNQLDPDLLPLIVRLAAGTGLTTAPGPNVTPNDGRIGPRVAEALAEHALGIESSDSAGSSSTADSGESAPPVSDGPVSAPISSDLAALAAQTILN